MEDKNSVKLIVTIAEWGKGNILEKWYIKQGIPCNYLCKGRGTASSELLDVLGLGSLEKDVLLSLASKDTTEKLLYKLDNESHDEDLGKGIVFDMPLTGLNSIVATVLLSEENKEMGGITVEQKTDYSLVLIAVNQGHTDEVMDTARAAGASGGTIIRARWAGDQDANHFYGISVQAEKEIIAIVASSENRNTIMEMVNKVHGLKSEAGAVVCSVGLDHSIRLA